MKKALPWIVGGVVVVGGALYFLSTKGGAQTFNIGTSGGGSQQPTQPKDNEWSFYSTVANVAGDAFTSLADAGFFDPDETDDAQASSDSAKAK